VQNDIVDQAKNVAKIFLFIKYWVYFFLIYSLFCFFSFSSPPVDLIKNFKFYFLRLLNEVFLISNISLPLMRNPLQVGLSLMENFVSIYRETNINNISTLRVEWNIFKYVHACIRHYTDYKLTKQKFVIFGYFLSPTFENGV
jgi:hypothetical protein